MVAEQRSDVRLLSLRAGFQPISYGSNLLLDFVYCPQSFSTDSQFAGRIPELLHAQTGQQPLRGIRVIHKTILALMTN